MKPQPPYWRVPIEGSDLERIDTVDMPDLAIIKVSEATYLVANEFEQLNDATRIWERAKKLVAIINGAASLEYGTGFKPLTVGAVERVNANGTIDGFITASAGRLTLAPLRASLSAEVRQPDGTIRRSEPSEPLAVKALRHGVCNDHVAYALELLNEPSWGNLYKIHERMRDVLGSNYNAVINQSKTRLKRFTQTANYGRHDPNTLEAPANPPSQNDAVKFFRQNVRRWIASLDDFH